MNFGSFGFLMNEFKTENLEKIKKCSTQNMQCRKLFLQLEKLKQ